MTRKTRYLLISLLILPILIWLLVTASGPRPEPRFRVTDLGALPGARGSYATDINDLGEVVGTSGGAYSRPAFLWRSSTGMIDLGAIGGDPRINNRGEVVGFTYMKSATESIWNSYIWSSTEGLEDLGTFGKDRSGSIAINDRSEVLVSASWKEEQTPKRSASEPSAFISGSSGSVKPLVAPEGQTIWVDDINNSGTVIGTLRTATNMPNVFIQEGFRWSESEGMQIPENVDNLRFRRLNNLGDVVGARIIGSNETEAVLWEGSQVITLPGLGGDFCSAHDINDRKQIVGFSTTRVGENIYAFQKWQAKKGSGLKRFLRSLATHLGGSEWAWQQPLLWEEGIPRNLNIMISGDSGWILWDAEAINNSGQIVGLGVHYGENRAFLLTPISEIDPD